MYKRIKIRNLRAISELEIDNLGQVNLIVGQNGCGKTTFLESVFFLVGATNPQLPLSVNVFRDVLFLSNQLWPTYFHNMDLAVPIEILGSSSETVGDEKLVIRALEASQETNNQVASNTISPSSEAIFVTSGLKLDYTCRSKPETHTVSTISLEGNKVVTKGTKERSFRGIFVSPVAIYDWKERFAEIQKKKQVAEVTSLLQVIEPQISDLRLNEVGLLLADIGLPELIPANLMGGGIAKFLSVALAILDCRDGVVLIDEIENGLHYSAQQKLWEAVFNWSQRLNVQVFATTHSSENIRAFGNTAQTGLFESKAKLFRIERQGDAARAVEYSRDLLSESLASQWEVR